MAAKDPQSRRRLKRHSSLLEAVQTSLMEQIRALRDAEGLSQKELAKRAGVSTDVLQRLEGRTSGHGGVPTLGSVVQVASALGVSPAELLGGGGASRTYRPEVARIAALLEDQPDDVVEVAATCVRALVGLGAGSGGPEPST